jgi:3-oxoacyl-[acyl-carrier protein] reductase
MSQLTGHVAAVTGAGRGLGAAYALRLATLGAAIAVLDIDLHSYEHYEREIEELGGQTVTDAIAALGVPALGVEVDLTDSDATDKAFETVREKLGAVDILVANAGGGSMGVTAQPPASQLTSGEIRAVVERNLYSTMFSCSAVAPGMKSLGRGKIVTVGSDAGLAPTIDGTMAHYGAAKAAIIIYTKYLAQELGQYGITVNCIAPGYISTGRVMKALEETGLEEVQSHIALRRIGTPEDCARVIEFLTTGLSDYVTGAVVEISPHV